MHRFFVLAKRFVVLLATDLFTLYASLFLAVIVRDQLLTRLLDLPSSDFGANYYFFSLWWIPTLYLLVFWSERLYTHQKPFWDEVKVLLRAVIVVSVLIYAVVSLGRLTDDVSRVVMIIQPPIALGLVVIARRFVKIFSYYIGIWREPVLVLQLSGATTIQADFSVNPYIGFELNAEIDISNHPPIAEVLEKVYQIRKEKHISTVLINADNMENQYFNELIESLYFAVPHILIVPKKINVDVTNSEIYHLAFNNLFVFDIRKGLNKTSSLVMKRVIDIVTSVLAIVIASPLILLIAILIKMEDGGSVLYFQERFGKNGKKFKFFKFRSMYINNDTNRITTKNREGKLESLSIETFFKKNPQYRANWEKYQKFIGNDPRVTGIGRFIRKYSLDELPQLFNIFIGDMSFIGPRPYLPREKEKIGKYFDRILAVKPGLTGLWQVSGRNKLPFQKRIGLDIVYIQNWSFWMDIVIAVKTVRILFEKLSAF